MSQRAAADLKEELEIGAPIRRQIATQVRDRYQQLMETHGPWGTAHDEVWGWAVADVARSWGRGWTPGEVDRWARGLWAALLAWVPRHPKWPCAAGGHVGGLT